MSEGGEFKKRINAQVNDGRWPEEKDAEVVADDLLEWIDEAKKEFEQLIHGNWDVDEEGFHPDRYAKDSWLTPREAIKWFRKWFGDKK